MRLNLAVHRVDGMSLGHGTRLVGSTLRVDSDELTLHFIEDPRLQRVDLEIFPPGDLAVRALARAALTQLGHGDLVLRFREDSADRVARADIDLGGRSLASITGPATQKLDLVKSLSQS